MKILYFYQYFGTPKGGWSTRVYEMCRRWVAEGHEVRVITSLYDKSDLTARGIYTVHQIEGIEVYVVNVTLSNKHSFLFRIYTFLAYAFWATFLGLKLKGDILIASSGPITIGIPALITKWLKRKPLVFEVRDLWPEGAVAFKIITHSLIKKGAYWFEGLCYNNSKLVVTASKGMSNSIKSRYPAVEILTIPNAADVDLFRFKDVRTEELKRFQYKKLFVYTGTLGLIDDCAQILRAAAVLQQRNRKDIHLLIIGDGKERPALEELSKNLQLSNLDFLGLMPKEALITYLRAARASILTVKPIPFMDNCSPNKIFDAFGAGIPILQTTQGWIKELVEQEKCGLNVEPGNPEQFADAIIRLADEEALFQELASNAARLGDTTFNRDLLSRKMLAGIEKIA